MAAKLRASQLQPARGWGRLPLNRTQQAATKSSRCLSVDGFVRSGTGDCANPRASSASAEDPDRKLGTALEHEAHESMPVMAGMTTPAMTAPTGP